MSNKQAYLPFSNHAVVDKYPLENFLYPERFSSVAPSEAESVTVTVAEATYVAPIEAAPKRPSPDVYELQSTLDFGVFTIREDNRKINLAHVRRLMLTIGSTNDLHLNPIIVNEDFEVIDGQHRLKAAEKLNVPIYYLIDSNFQSSKMVSLNTTQLRWKIDDYLNYWESNGLSDYRKIHELSKKYKLTLTCLLVWLCGQKESIARFKNGLFSTDIDDDTRTNLDNFLLFREYFEKQCLNYKSFFAHRAFHKALKSFFCCEQVDVQSFFSKLQIAPIKFIRRHLLTEYIVDFAEVYNYHRSKDRLKLTIDHKSISISR